MLSSLQLGLSVKMREASAALICLGDQPQVEERSVRSICEAFLQSKSPLVVPSYNMQRGHPWLIARPLWDELLAMKSPKTARDFLKKQARNIQYVIMDSPTVIEDLDTPEDYLKYKPAL
jgi:molybdenum cofactor cytidylyltransferase